MIGKFLVARCAADPTITTLVGSRIYPVAAPQGTATPFLTYSVAESPADTNKITGETKYNYTVAIRAYAHLGESVEAYTKLESIRDAMRAEFNFNDGTSGGVIVEGSHYEGSSDGMEGEVDFFFKEMRFSFRVRLT